jgi:hypothetical protein
MIDGPALHMHLNMDKKRYNHKLLIFYGEVSGTQ